MQCLSWKRLCGDSARPVLGAAPTSLGSREWWTLGEGEETPQYRVCRRVNISLISSSNSQATCGGDLEPCGGTDLTIVVDFAANGVQKVRQLSHIRRVWYNEKVRAEYIHDTLRATETYKKSGILCAR